MTEPQKKWIDALRSGKYKQGKHLLHNVSKNTWCCLGVVCDLFDKEFPGKLYVQEEFGARYYNHRNGYIPEEVKEWLGLSDSFGGHFTCGEYRTLVILNDKEGYSFKQIADLIESKPEGLFVE